MARVRRNVWSLQQPWDPVLLWYARGVKALKSKPFADVTSWRYLGAMHGFDEDLWKEFGWLSEKAPDTREFLEEDSNQCQHHGWYFIPWHRGYLAAFEAIIRAAIEQMPGAPKDWALPYWDYNTPVVADPQALPEAFSKNAWPDGGDNPLFEPRRYGSGDGTVVIRDVDVDLKQALGSRRFEGQPNVSPGLGGIRTPFQQMADRPNEGFLEQVPHDVVHGRVGGLMKGKDPKAKDAWKFMGLMAFPQSAGLDPVFWVHHCNIDRLWDVWLKRDPANANPTQSAWLNGPSGKQRFIVPRPDGTRKPFAPKDMLDTTAAELDYVYENTDDPLGGKSRFDVRLEGLLAASGSRAVPAAGKSLMPEDFNVELLGANAKELRLQAGSTSTVVAFDRPTSQKLSESFVMNGFAARVGSEPDRVFLNLENITGQNDAAVFDVYVGLPDGADPAQHPENRAGVVSLFGVRAASDKVGSHGGQGLTKVLEVTDVIDRMHLSGSTNLGELPVTFVPVSNVGDGAISIQRVSVYRQHS